jgi:hypothetical protein
MKTYSVTAPMGITLSSGKVKLTTEQVRRRVRHLKTISADDGIYEIIAPTSFKCGEKIGFDGDPGKSIMTMLADVDAPTAKPQGTAPAKPVAQQKGHNRL